MLMMNDLNIRFFDSASLPAFIGCKWGVGCMCLFVFDLCQLRGGVVHAWVEQKRLNCNVFKTIFERPTGTRVEGRGPARGGHGRP